MPSTREIRRRIRSVKNISQVTRAMQMVAAAKMRRAQEQVLATRPYTEKAWEILTHLAAQRGADEEAHPLLRVREPVGRAGLVLITADKGLAGSYNHNMILAASRFVREVPYPVEVVAVGKRGRDAMWRLKQNIVAEFTDMPAQPRILDVTAIAHTVMDSFVSGHYDVVYLAFTDFINTLRQQPAIWQLLPLHALHVAVSTPVAEFRSVQETESTVEYIYEPDPSTILETVLPRFTELQIYQAILESIASEHSARMVAMRNATENANELLDILTLTYNRARQEAITKEMLDIAGGAEALSSARA
ncbi:MAG: ATP synthase F1 subunit gamma [Anaerolineae bacterium]|nr:ATP synthase F1 subunit gamma [Anaerolineae bacterium]MDX9829945.1 ATP synthase F1 subunit gamma [Anaerolineae bacterium]